MPPTRKAELVFEDGTRLAARSFGAHLPLDGEVVFQTGMVGYSEALTDPSYEGQLLTMTVPMVGNYGVPDRKRRDKWGLPKGFESDRIHAKAIICQDYSHHYSHWDAKSSLGDWLSEEGVVGLCGIDTRALTKKIRDSGALLARVEYGPEDAQPAGTPFADPNARNLVAEVSHDETRIFNEGGALKILAVDCGIKANIIRCLAERGAEVHVVPWDADLAGLMKTGGFDGLFLSNGPGDPAVCQVTIDNLKQVLAFEGSEVKPIFGICLGNQLLSIAAGAKTRKLPFGNRGQNQPVTNLATGECYITPQNHGYEVVEEGLPAGWKPLFRNANDGSNEGIQHEARPYFTAQFHPEACGGPTDTAFLFDVFLERCKAVQQAGDGAPQLDQQMEFARPTAECSYSATDVKKVLVLGSGGLSIGQAGEFDYSGSQGIKALKEEGKEVVLINPNIASVQTNVAADGEAQADQVFFLPVTPEFVEQVIARERPDSILISMGGQTALNCGVTLHDTGVLEKYGVRVLGTSVEAIRNTEDRELFNNRLAEIGESVAPSITAVTVEAALEAAEEIGYPCMIRSAFALGGLGSGICHDAAQLRTRAAQALSMSPQILVEQSMLGWKELEYEVVRDSADNCITVCNMENFDPLGVHTGDSIVIAPSQTISNEEYHMLREVALRVVRHLGIIGECNIQYALHPTSLKYCIIEVNPRLSRSSALASKATGYPLAFVAAKLGLGVNLPDIRNSITKKTSACFEPSLDYVVTKVPRWDLDKFSQVSTEIGSAMKSVGEVMAIGRTWEESMQKALRMIDPAVPGFCERGLAQGYSTAERKEVMRNPTDQRLWAIACSLHDGSLSVDDIAAASDIDPWFLRRLERIATVANGLKADAAAAGGGAKALGALGREAFEEAKQLGFSDAQVATLLGADPEAVRAARQALGLRPWVKQIDTLAAEYPAQTNYLYCTYHGDSHDDDGGGGGALVMGSGAYRIGSSVEFDWCAVSCVRTLQKLGQRTVMVNYNPETVSTDYDECDQLYFDELSLERVRDIYEHEVADGAVVSVGGQIPQNLALPLHEAGVRVYGTSPLKINEAEDRQAFSDLVDALGVDQPAWRELKSGADAAAFAEQVGYPVLVRPSFVLSGAAMKVAYGPEELATFLTNAAAVSGDGPVVVSKYLDGAREIEVDGVASGGLVVGAAMHEHVENAGVHSGDATLLLPTQTVSAYTRARCADATAKIVKALEITGPFNVQFLAKGAQVKVIECNLRASRSVPFVSKAMGVDMIEAATRVLLGHDAQAEGARPLPLLDNPDDANRPSEYVACKSPMFSYTRLRGADPLTGVEMASTGEVACFGKDAHEAFLKALLSTTMPLPTPGGEAGILVSVQESLSDQMVPAIFNLQSAGYKLLATAKTHAHLSAHGIECTLVGFPSDADNGEDTEPANVLSLMKSERVSLVINLPTSDSLQLENNYLIRRTAVDYGVPVFTNPQLVTLLAESLARHHPSKSDKKGGLILEPSSLFDHYDAEAKEDAWSSPSEFH